MSALVCGLKARARRLRFDWSHGVRISADRPNLAVAGHCFPHPSRNSRISGDYGARDRSGGWGKPIIFGLAAAAWMRLAAKWAFGRNASIRTREEFHAEARLSLHYRRSGHAGPVDRHSQSRPCLRALQRHRVLCRGTRRAVVPRLAHQIDDRLCRLPCHPQRRGERRHQGHLFQARLDPSPHQARPAGRRLDRSRDGLAGAHRQVGQRRRRHGGRDRRRQRGSLRCSA